MLNKNSIFFLLGNQVQPPQWTGMNQSPMGNVPNAIRPPPGRGQIPGKNIPGTMPPPQSAKPQVAPFPSASPAKRDIVFPSKLKPYIIWNINILKSFVIDPF